MLRTIKPKNARVKRALAKREPKLKENTKTAIFIRGSNASQIVTTALKDLSALKKPDSINFSRKNEILPFEPSATSSLEFFSQKNDAAIMVVGTHQKKRPHNLVFIRTFDHQILDMIEVGVEKSHSLGEFKKSASFGMKPAFVFTGSLFDTNPTYQHLKSVLLDTYRGQEMPQINLAGLEYVVCVTVPDESTEYDKMVYFRVYQIRLKKSGKKQPRVELEEMGPSFDFKIRRVQTAQEDMMKNALKQPKELKPRNVKNIDVDPMGDKMGRIHLGKQDLSKLQSRKMKGLKKRRDDEGSTLVGSETGDRDTLDLEDEEYSDDANQDGKRSRA